MDWKIIGFLLFIPVAFLIPVLFAYLDDLGKISKGMKKVYFVVAVVLMIAIVYGLSVALHVSEWF